jgi:hypothetical protein
MSHAIRLRRDAELVSTATQAASSGAVASRRRIGQSSTSNIRAYSTGTARPVIFFFSGSGEVEVATLINVARQNTATAGIVVQSGGSVKLVNYMQLNASAQVAAVRHDFIVTKASAYAFNQSDRYVLADATRVAFTVTLPSAALCPGKLYTVKKTDSSTHSVTVATTAGQPIDGATR